MIRMGFLLFIAMMAATSASGQTSTNCPGFGSPIENVIYYVNGVGNTDKNMRDSRDLLRFVIGNTSKNRYDIAENRSDGMTKDFWQAYENRRDGVVDPRSFWSEIITQEPGKSDNEIRELYADAMYSASVLEYGRSPDLREMVNDFYEDLNAGKKVVLVAHSQGNFFANAAYRFIVENWPKFKDSIGIVAVGTPAPIVEGNGFLTQNSEDSIIFGAVTSKYSVPPANVTFNGNDPYKTDHGFITTYMLAGNARSRIAGHVVAMINRLVPPISPCDEDIALVKTRTAKDVKAGSATLRADLTQGKNAAVWFEVGDVTTPITCNAANQSNGGTYAAPYTIEQSINALTPNTTYNYRACGKGVKGGVSDGGLVQFITPRNRAAVDSPTLVLASKDSLDVKATVLEGVAVDAWITLTSSNIFPSCNGQPYDGTGLYSAGNEVTGRFADLQPSTRYRVKACAKGSDGVTVGSPTVSIATSDIPIQNCGSSFFQGGTEGLSVIFNLGSNGGVANVFFNTFEVPDSLRIFKKDSNQLLFTTNGFVSGTHTGSFSANGINTVDVYVTGNALPGTRWELAIECPQ